MMRACVISVQCFSSLTHPLPSSAWSLSGMLTKIKSSKGKDKARHFRLTENTFSYYESNAGACIAKVKKTDIIHVEDVVNTKQFRMRTSVGE